ncbi:hypothetical protein CBM2592_A190017 [Cupriavidus taiwanensis]|nr:hypothetical protein CBM2592_A190017 [Cupriavidus taiwanensis]SOY83041.1 hypothetical protein CBM2591_A230019 [Cupriavidus taiwanensis]SOZ56225.1 hypothetical protein CBM2617_A200026 [Cupriavidus taiwanensis]SOZ78810.1 hypothetical protein CBM2618_A180025 [Cupriavidus taiwanensis]SOZ79084.1 hypothetical protein CBM2622_A170024 [Cupriavidus taiwanensis]
MPNSHDASARAGLCCHEACIRADLIRGHRCDYEVLASVVQFLCRLFCVLMFQRRTMLSSLGINLIKTFSVYVS